MDGGSVRDSVPINKHDVISVIMSETLGSTHSSLVTIFDHHIHSEVRIRLRMRVKDRVRIQETILRI